MKLLTVGICIVTSMRHRKDEKDRFKLRHKITMTEKSRAIGLYKDF